MLLVLACKKGVIYLFLFVYLFVSDFCFCSRAKVGTGDHLRTLDFTAKMSSSS